MIYAYVRVSAKDQCEDRQIDALKGYEIDEFFIDKASGKNFDRPQYKRLLKVIKKGDLLVIHSIDRLGRNFEDILEQWRFLTKEIGVQIYVITMPILDTRKENDLLNSVIINLVLQLLSFVAETERKAIKDRQREGIEAARARGKPLGRPMKPVPPEFDNLVKEWKDGKITREEMLKQLGMSKSTFYRIRNQRNK